MLKAAAAKVYQTGLALMLGAAFALASPAALARKAPEVGVPVSGFETVSLADLPAKAAPPMVASCKAGRSRTTRTARYSATVSAYFRARPEATTVNTRCARRARNRVRGASSAAACSPRCPDACFYTGDHYNSFQQIVQ